MTESEWLASEDPAAMLAWRQSPFATGRTPVSGRKLRMFDEACFDSIGTTIHVLPTVKSARMAALLREIIGNPFRPVTLRAYARVPANPIDPEPWLTPQVLSLAQAAYDDPQADGTLDPVRLSILADALEEAGCSDHAILTHLRSQNEVTYGVGKAWQYKAPQGPHVRGCWAMDLILGKE